MYDENLTVSLDDRLPFSEYMPKIKSLSGQLPALHDFSPSQQNAALQSIKATDPSTWKKGFEMKEIQGKNACCPGSVVLAEPVGNAYDHMLMRFSGEDMGFYTTISDVFRKDKQEARDYFQEQTVIPS